MKMLTPCLLFAALLPSLNAAEIDNVKRSTWDTTYQDDAGTFVVDAVVTLDGESGTYELSSGARGTLENLRYAYITPAPEKKVGVYGTWRLGSAEGGFTFRVLGDESKFGGQWSQGMKRGTWSGTKR